MDAKEENAEDNTEEAPMPMPIRASSLGASATSVESGNDSTTNGGVFLEGEEPADDTNAECRSQEATFPQQLMDVIEKETTDGTDASDGKKVMEWLPNGDAFIIRDKSLLEKEVLPKYFNAKCKFMSFVRKLYRYVISRTIQVLEVFEHNSYPYF